VPDEEKCVAFLRAQKNLVEQNSTKGVLAPSARPTAVLRNPNRRTGGEQLPCVKR